MDSSLWYLIALAGIFVLSLSLWFLSSIIPNIHNSFTRHITYPLFLKRRRFWDSITRLQAFLIVFFLVANLIVIFAPFKDVDWRQVERRAAFTAGVNAIPLCLGGRMGPVVQMLNIHRSSYLLFHHWVGRIAVLEALSHALIVLLLRPHTGTLVTSGWVVSDIFPSRNFTYLTHIDICRVFGGTRILFLVAEALARALVLAQSQGHCSYRRCCAILARTERLTSQITNTSRYLLYYMAYFNPLQDAKSYLSSALGRSCRKVRWAKCNET
jgi:hypothetical protein